MRTAWGLGSRNECNLFGLAGCETVQTDQLLWYHTDEEVSRYPSSPVSCLPKGTHVRLCKLDGMTCCSWPVSECNQCFFHWWRECLSCTDINQKSRFPVAWEFSQISRDQILCRDTQSRRFVAGSKYACSSFRFEETSSSVHAEALLVVARLAS